MQHFGDAHPLPTNTPLPPPTETPPPTPTRVRRRPGQPDGNSKLFHRGICTTILILDYFLIGSGSDYPTLLTTATTTMLADRIGSE